MLHEIGEILDGKYRLVELLGEGGMGAVFLAVHQQIGKQVAIKFLHSDDEENARTVARFQREAMAAAAIGHPGIVDVYDMGTSEKGSPYLVMECLQGRSLREELDARGRLSVHETAFIGCQVLSALDAAHAKGIIHRDLKPDNIFLADVGRETPESKLLDFGISKIVNHEFEGKSITTTGTVLGTPFYMSPEQARGQTEFDVRSDIYAMGVILYECLTEEIPSKGANYNEVIVNILTRAIRPPSYFVDSIPADVEKVVLKALAKEADDRYMTAVELLEALLPFVDERQVSQLSLASTGQIGRSHKAVVDKDHVSYEKTLRSDEAEQGASYATDETIDVSSEERKSASVKASTHDSEKSLEASSSKGWHSVAQQSALDETGQEGEAVLGAGTSAGSQAEQSAGSNRGRLLLVLFLALLGVAALALLGTSHLRRGTSDGEAANTAELNPLSTKVVVEDGGEASSTTDTSVPTAVDDGDVAQVDSRQKTIEVRIAFEPAEAKLFIDDALLPENPFVGRFPRDELSHRLRAEADGYQPLGLIIVFDRDREISQSLVALRTSSRPGPSKIKNVGRREESSKREPTKERRNPEDDPWRDL